MSEKLRLSRKICVISSAVTIARTISVPVRIDILPRRMVRARSDRLTKKEKRAHQQKMADFIAAREIIKDAK